VGHRILRITTIRASVLLSTVALTGRLRVLPSLLLELVQYFVPVLCPHNSLPLLAASHRSLLKTILRLSLPLLAHRGGLPVWHCIIRVPASIGVAGPASRSSFIQWGVG